MLVTSGMVGIVPVQHPWHGRTCQMDPIIIKRTIVLLNNLLSGLHQFIEVEITSAKMGVMTLFDNNP